MRKLVSFALGASLVMAGSINSVSYALSEEEDALNFINNMALATAYKNPTDPLVAMEAIKSLPTAYEDQEQCLQSLHVLEFAYSLPDLLSNKGYKYLQAQTSLSREQLKDYVREVSPRVLMNFGIQLEKFSWNHLELLQGLNLINTADNYLKLHKDDYGKKDYMLIFAKQKKRCYTYFQEFEEDPEYGFEIYEPIGLPQDIGWDSIPLKFFGKEYKLDFDGNPIQ